MSTAKCNSIGQKQSIVRSHLGYVIKMQIYHMLLLCKFVEEVEFEALIVGARVNISFCNLVDVGNMT